MSNVFTPRVPNFIDRSIFEGTNYLDPYPFDTIDQLMEHPHVILWTNRPDFVRLCVDDEYIMAILSDSSRFAIGHVTDPDLIDL